MTTETADVLADPVGLNVDLVAGVELALDRTAITAVVTRVAGGRARQRRLARCLAGRPSVLADGRSPASELPRVFWTGNLRLIHAASCPFRYSSRTSCGVRYPSVEWRRVLL